MILKNLPKEARQGMAALALYGVTTALMCPDSLTVFMEAQRIIFTDSIEFKNISELLEIDIFTLRKNVFAYLGNQGFDCTGKSIH
ncbi:MAG: hypothetical protein WAW09_08515 [Smithella sp.]